MHRMYDRTAATQTLKLSTTLLSISCGIRPISLLMMSSVCELFSQTVFQVPPQKIVRRVEILEIGWPGVIGLTRNESVLWGVIPEVFKFSVREMRWVFCSRNEAHTSGITSHGTDSSRVKPITPGHPIPKISTCLTILWGGTWKTEFMKTIYRQERTSSEKRSDRSV